MTDKQTPPDWVLIEGVKRAGYHWLNRTVEDLREYYGKSYNGSYTAICDMIEKYEQLTAENERLRAALLIIAQHTTDSWSHDIAGAVLEWISKETAETFTHSDNV